LKHAFLDFYIYKLICKAPQGRNFRGAVSSHRQPKPSHCTYPRRDGQAEWTWINTEMVDPPKVVTNPRSNRARRSLTSLMQWFYTLTQATMENNV